MKAGNELKDPANWKKGQILITSVGTIVGLSLHYVVPNKTFPPEFIDAVTQGIAYILIAVNLILTKATSKKV